MDRIDARADARIEAYVAARRDLLALWRAKRRLFESVQSRFPKSHPLFKTISKLCHNDATCQIRHLCDIAICKAADKFGDDAFRNHEVDGVCIPAVTHWYYGIVHLLPRENVVTKRLNRTHYDKQLTHSDIELFEDVYRLGRKFIDSASVLPFLPVKEFTTEETRFDKSFEKAREKLETASPAYSAYLQLQKRLPKTVAGEIVALSQVAPE